MTKKKKETQDDVTWKHCTKVGDGKKTKLKCNYCGKEYSGGVFRIKHHLACTHENVVACAKVESGVKEFFFKLLEENKMKKQLLGDEYDGGDEEGGAELVGEKRKLALDAFAQRFQPLKKKSSGTTTTLNSIWKKQDRDDLCVDVARMLYANALPFHLVKNHYFIKMLQNVAKFGNGFKPPSYHEVRTTFLVREVNRIKVDLMGKYKKEWNLKGCTIMSDGWTDGKNRSITNFLVNSPKGTFFLKSIDTSDETHSGDYLFELLDGVIEEIGEENVVQVVTDGASAYVSAGAMLMEKRKTIFWNPCAAHCLNLMLQDIGELPTHVNTISKARKITVFIYRHGWVLNKMRKCTKGRELLRPGVTRFATNYLTLRSIHTCKKGLKQLFTCQEWQDSLLSKKGSLGYDVQQIVLADARFWDAIKYCLKCVLPLVKILRLVDGDAKPAMGYIYEAMDKAREKILSNFKGVASRCHDVLEIVLKRWNYQLHRPLHAAAYYLNPTFHYSPTFLADHEVKKGLIQCIEIMCPTPQMRLKVDRQLEKFHNAEDLFGSAMAIQLRDKKQPALWWDTYGGSCPELQTLAIRILSCTCSATGCERNWSVFDHVHSKKRNRLEQQRLSNLVYVKYNLQLEARQETRVENGDSYDPISLEDMESDDEWITEKETPCLPTDNSWMDVHECFEVGESSKKKKRGPRDLRLKDKGKEKVQEVEKEKEDTSEDDDDGVESEEDVSSMDDD